MEMLPPYMFSLLVPSLQVSGSLGAPRHNFLPAVLDTGEEVFDENHVLFEGEVLEVRPRLVEGDHYFPVTAHVFLQALEHGRTLSITTDHETSTGKSTSLFLQKCLFTTINYFLSMSRK